LRDARAENRCLERENHCLAEENRDLRADLDAIRLDNNTVKEEADRLRSENHLLTESAARAMYKGSLASTREPEEASLLQRSPFLKAHTDPHASLPLSGYQLQVACSAGD
jgi:hypothetical protein